MYNINIRRELDFIGISITRVKDNYLEYKNDFKYNGDYTESPTFKELQKKFKQYMNRGTIICSNNLRTKSLLFNLLDCEFIDIQDIIIEGEKIKYKLREI